MERYTKLSLVNLICCYQLLPGAGAVEIELARQIESMGEKCPGLEQYAIKKFAYALETLPKALAENAGMDVRFPFIYIITLCL